MIRESGLYATRDSHTFQVAYRAGAYVALHRFEGEPHTADLVPIRELTALERITTTAEWQGTRVVVDRVRPSRLVWVRTTDVALAERLEPLRQHEHRLGHRRPPLRARGHPRGSNGPARLKPAWHPRCHDAAVRR